MKEKFVYCTDEKISNELMNKLNLINIQKINNKQTWIFENNESILKFNNKELNSIKFTNKIFI